METQKVNPKGIIDRIKAETPVFWKKIRKLMAASATIGAALTAAKTQYAMTWLPDELAHGLILVGLVGAGLATMTCENPKEPEQGV